jgi:hypothetical protein
MPSNRIPVTLRLVCIGAVLSLTEGCGASSRAALPDAAETRSVHVVLMDDFGVKIVSDCTVHDPQTIRGLIDCVTPNEESEFAAKMISNFPISGKLTFVGPRGSTSVEFVDNGKQPLHFRVAGRCYERGGGGYRAYRSDHKRLYGLDSEIVSECLCLRNKLRELCCQPQGARANADIRRPPENTLPP